MSGNIYNNKCFRYWPSSIGHVCLSVLCVRSRPRASSLSSQYQQFCFEVRNMISRLGVWFFRSWIVFALFRVSLATDPFSIKISIVTLILSKFKIISCVSVQTRNEKKFLISICVQKTVSTFASKLTHSLRLSTYIMWGRKNWRTGKVHNLFSKNRERNQSRARR